MPRLITSADVESVVIEVLCTEGQAVTPRPDKTGTVGTDIIACRAAEKIHIEAISFKSRPQARSKDFFEVFFRALSRLDCGATCCVLALPYRFSAGLRLRAKHYMRAWQRIVEAFPELEIWLVDIQFRTVEKTKWLEWLSR